MSKRAKRKGSATLRIIGGQTARLMLDSTEEKATKNVKVFGVWQFWERRTDSSMGEWGQGKGVGRSRSSPRRRDVASGLIEKKERKKQGNREWRVEKGGGRNEQGLGRHSCIREGLKCIPWHRWR